MSIKSAADIPMKMGFNVHYAEGSDHVAVQGPVPGYDGWMAEVEFLPDGRVYNLSVRPMYKGLDIDAGITVRMLRSLKFSDFEAALREVLRRTAKTIDPDDSMRHLLSIGEQFMAEPHPGKRGRGDDFYARLASDYVSLLGTQRDPVVALAERMGQQAGREVRPQTVRNQLTQARKRGLLTTVGRGRAGGELTERARQLLRDGQ